MFKLTDGKQRLLNIKNFVYYGKQCSPIIANIVYINKTRYNRTNIVYYNKQSSLIIANFVYYRKQCLYDHLINMLLP
jgi:hypothetical protein